MKALAAIIGIILGVILSAWADGPADNNPLRVRPVPPAGIEVPGQVRTDLMDDVIRLGQEIDALRQSLAGKPDRLRLVADVVIFHKAVRYALDYNEVFATNEWEVARELLVAGRERAKALGEGRAPWTTARGLVVRGYVSRIDGSVQPYGLVVPESFQPQGAHRHRLDVWLHGRGEKLTELAFLHQRMRSPGQFVPEDTIVLHPYGRYCNGNRFAGETDVFEAMDAVRQDYRVDEDRVVVRGFSLGGAACWHLAVHHAGLWAAAAPGAGFSETEIFLREFQGEDLEPEWYERALWHLYDATDYAINLVQCPTVAYSGEKDKQRRAAEIMGEAMAAEGLNLVHLIGPDTGHAYHPDLIPQINRRIDSAAAAGRERVPRRVRFTTYTLRYNEMLWVRVDGLQQHWARARVDAELVSDRMVRVETENVSRLTLRMDAGRCPLDPTQDPEVEIDGDTLEVPRPASDRSWEVRLQKEGRRWRLAGEEPSGLRKQHGLQGPIDDAFMDSFLVVKPTGRPMNSKVGTWVDAELARFIREWRRHYRGEVRLKNDTDVTEEDMRLHHLILWGDPTSNVLIRRVAPRLPVRWDTRGVQTPDANYPADRYVPILIHPNPLQPDRYVVFNSGFTFREYDYLNNARQNAKLPDFAVIDLSVSPSTVRPGGIAAAGFFGERWEWVGMEDGRRKN